MERFITAEQARFLVNESDAGIDYILKELDRNISDAARNGETSIASYVTHTWFSRPVNDITPINPTDVQLKVSKYLKKYGYSVTLATHGGSYIPKGLSDDFGMGPAHVNWCLHIRW